MHFISVSGANKYFLYGKIWLKKIQDHILEISVTALLKSIVPLQFSMHLITK